MRFVPGCRFRPWSASACSSGSRGANGSASRRSTPRRRPSFYVNDQKHFFHDFSSGKHGDIFTFVMETEGLSFSEAVERLAGEAGRQRCQRADPRCRGTREGAREPLSR